MWGPLLSSLQKGGFLVSWVANYLSETGIHGQLFSSTGDKLGDDFPVSSWPPSGQADPQIVWLGDDGLLACWMSAEQDGSGWGVYGQILASDGRKIGKEFRINTCVESDQLFPVVVSLGDSGFVACWQSRGQDGSGSGVFAKRYPASPVLHALVPFSLIRPSDGDSIATVNPALTWHQAGAGTVAYPWELHYRIYIDENPEFPSPRIMEQDQDTTAAVDGLLKGGIYFWKVLAGNIAGDSLWSSSTNVFFVCRDASSVEEEKSKLPGQYILHPNYPNPFNPETSIWFDLRASGFVSISVYDVNGRVVRVLVSESRNAGSYLVKWNGKDSFGNPLPSGIYLCRMEVRSTDGRGVSQSVKMGLVR
jgi:hypothetical protein